MKKKNFHYKSTEILKTIVKEPYIYLNNIAEIDEKFE